jgi:hypothetical protein
MSAPSCPLVIAERANPWPFSNLHEVHLTNIGAQLYGLWVRSWSVHQECFYRKKLSAWQNGFFPRIVDAATSHWQRTYIHCLFRCLYRKSHREEWTCDRLREGLDSFTELPNHQCDNRFTTITTNIWDFFLKELELLAGESTHPVHCRKLQNSC